MTVPDGAARWPAQLFEVLRRHDVSHIGYVPDAGHAELIDSFIEDPDLTATVCTTEEEAVAIAAGSWLGGVRSAVLMQSSGVGNSINMLSLPVQSRSPLLLIVTMRGEWAEFNPWQVPMGQATQACLEAIGMQVVRATSHEAIAPTTAQAAAMAFEADQQVAVLIGQELLGEKTW